MQIVFPQFVAQHESQRTVPLPGLLLGVLDGGLLEQRVLCLMERRLPWARRWRVVAAGCCVVVMAVASMSVGVLGVRASALQTERSFEAASVKRSDPERKLHGSDSSPDSFQLYGYSVKLMIEHAYGLKDVQLEGAPEWPELYDVSARADAATAERLKGMNFIQRDLQFRPMLQSLLAERFNLRVRRESKTLPVYVLTVSKGGPKLKASAEQIAPVRESIANRFIEGGFEVKGTNAPMALLAETAAGYVGGNNSVVLDETGLKGRYDFVLRFDRQPNGAGGTEVSESELRSMMQRQLGVELVKQQRPVDVWVVEHMERPSEN